MCLPQAAHAVVQLQETGRAVHKVKTTSLNAMCENYDLPTNPFRGKFLFFVVIGLMLAVGEGYSQLFFLY